MNRLVTNRIAEPTVPAGFVVCALPTLVPAGQLALVAEVYRLAAERTRVQLAPRRLNRVAGLLPQLALLPSTPRQTASDPARRDAPDAASRGVLGNPLC